MERDIKTFRSTQYFSSNLLIRFGVFSLGVIKLIVIARCGCGCGGQASKLEKEGGEGGEGGLSFFLRARLEAERVNKWICMAGLCEVDR